MGRLSGRPRIHAERRGRGRPPVENASATEARGAQLFAPLGIGGGAGELRLKLRGIVGFQSANGVAHGFRERTARGRKHGTTAGHGLDRRQAESLERRRKDKDICRAIPFRQIGRRHKTEAMDISRKR